MVGTNNQHELQRILNDLGSVGWEVVGFAGSDKTVGFNALVAVLRRALPDLPRPTDTTPGYKPDPFDPTRTRWWDGFKWLEFIQDARGDGRVFPVGFPAP